MRLCPAWPNCKSSRLIGALDNFDAKILTQSYKKPARPLRGFFFVQRVRRAAIREFARRLPNLGNWPTEDSWMKYPPRLYR